jgi:hypothetical protein
VAQPLKEITMARIRLVTVPKKSKLGKLQERRRQKKQQRRKK